MWEYLGIAAAFGLGWAIRNGGAKAQIGVAAQALSEKARNLDEAESRYLQTHQREIANLLLSIHPDLMEKAYRKARRRQDEAIEGGPARIEAELTALSHKYPFFQDFEAIGTRHFVPYSDAIDHWSEDDLLDRYLDISHWLALSFRKKHGDKVPVLFDDADQKVMERVVQEERDRKLRRRIEAAMELHRLFSTTVDRYGQEQFKHGAVLLETGEVSIRQGTTPYSPEIEYWISFREPEDYGVYSFFVHDDGHVSRSYYRANADFTRKDYLTARG
ncbi:hypothetical protein ELI54_08340 [Rhizobium ruizarguesonis]|uniref:hypothetical protein n=1 Tax=Rhizobium ruizarguesonis TaxID=2081791 RepID=UPI0010313721|nr:hypothetical protein [Rhizobium ruizarguesonis]TAT88218.1 hypothetical protein ELI54_08340 [Rhizobium ruizarguesonis]